MSESRFRDFVILVMLTQLGAYSTPEGLRSTTLGFKSSQIQISKPLELPESAKYDFPVSEFIIFRNWDMIEFGQILKLWPSRDPSGNQNRSAEAESAHHITCREFRAPLRDTSRRVILNHRELVDNWGRQESGRDLTSREEKLRILSLVDLILRPVSPWPTL